MSRRSTPAEFIKITVSKKKMTVPVKLLKILNNLKQFSRAFSIFQMIWKSNFLEISWVVIGFCGLKHCECTSRFTFFLPQVVAWTYKIRIHNQNLQENLNKKNESRSHFDSSFWDFSSTDSRWYDGVKSKSNEMENSDKAEFK